MGCSGSKAKKKPAQKARKRNDEEFAGVNRSGEGLNKRELDMQLPTQRSKVLAPENRVPNIAIPQDSKDPRSSRPRSPKETIKNLRSPPSGAPNNRGLDLRLDLDKLNQTKTSSLSLNLNLALEQEQDIPTAPLLSPRESSSNNTTVNVSLVNTVNVYERRKRNSRYMHLRIDTESAIRHSKFGAGDEPAGTKTENESVDRLIEGTDWNNPPARHMIQLLQSSSQGYAFSPAFYFSVAKTIKDYNDAEGQMTGPGVDFLFRKKDSKDTFVISDNELRILSGLLRDNCVIKTIRVHSALISKRGLKLFGQGLKFNSHIQSLSLRKDNMGDAEAELMLKGLIELQGSIIELNLSDNNIGDVGCFAVFRLLLAEKTKLRKINLCNNCFTEETLKFVLRVLPAYCRLEELCLMQKIGSVDDASFQLLNLINKQINKNLRHTKFLEYLMQTKQEEEKLFDAMMFLQLQENYVGDIASWFAGKSVFDQNKSRLQPQTSSSDNIDADNTSSGSNITKFLDEKSPETVLPVTNPIKQNINLSLKPEKHTFGFHLMKGCRAQMQDVILTKLNFRDKIDESVFAVFDGHGGVHTARYVRANFLYEFENALRKNIDLDLSEEEAVRISFSDSFEAVHNAIKMYDVPHGTCAVVVYIKGDKIYTATAGDSQALLVQVSEAELLHPASNLGKIEEKSKSFRLKRRTTNQSASSVDDLPLRHQKLSTVMRPSDPEELERISEANGLVLRGRVDGVLAVSRAIGDVLYQPKVTYSPVVNSLSLLPTCTCNNSKRRQQPVRQSTGEKAKKKSKLLRLRSTAGTQQDAECPACSQSAQEELNIIIMASDGLWDVMSEEEVVRCLTKGFLKRRESLRNIKSADFEEFVFKESFFRNTWEVSRNLCDEAYSQMSRDNISVICVVFKTPQTKTAPILSPAKT